MVKKADEEPKELTPLERARQSRVGIRTGRAYDDEVVELCVAWAKGELTMQQVANGLGVANASSAVATIANVFKRITTEGTWRDWLA